MRLIPLYLTILACTLIASIANTAFAAVDRASPVVTLSTLASTVPKSLLVAPKSTNIANEDLACIGASLAARHHCLACHQVYSKLVGPPLASIGDRYTYPDPLVAKRIDLAKSIRLGSRGKWGAVPMPAQPQVSELEALTLAEWIVLLARPEAK